MTLYDLAIAVTDENDLVDENGTITHKRKKEGDVIACRLHSETIRMGGWGTSELPAYLMVTVDMSDEEVTHLQIPQYEDGSFGEAKMGFYHLPPQDKWEANKTYINIDIESIDKNPDGSVTISKNLDSINEYDKIFTKENKGEGISGNTIPPEFQNANINDLIIDGTVLWKCTEFVRVKPYTDNTVYKVNDIVIDEDWVYKCISPGITSNNKKSLDKTYDINTEDGQLIFKCLGHTQTKPCGKRRFNIPLDILKDGWCPDMNLDNIRDKGKIHQPFMDNNIVIDSKEKVSLIKDKHKNSFKYKTKKIHGV